jgi:predicted nucleotidyltransferase
MKLKTYLYFNRDKLTIEWTDKPINFKGIELGKIISAEYNKETGSVELNMKVHKDKVDEVKKLLGVK